MDTDVISPTDNNSTIPSTNDEDNSNNNTTPIPSGDGSNTTPSQNNNPTESSDENNPPTEEPSKPEMPLTIDVYGYDYNGYYVGESKADKSPLDDTYLIPAYATIVKPPQVEDGKIPKWNGVSWDIVDIPKIPNEDSSGDSIEKLRNTVNEQQVILNEHKGRIEALEQLVNGLIIASIKVN